ncbi:hypothetical protein BKA70DRAFT_1431103 [Coprinopsis sp. MPI-PUGE-AT-0042]|nr:hypothetical protein BKA70DRAFT_1431103 [Coprinopsis sp. MPI-PUGE-AT-0042]
MFGPFILPERYRGLLSTRIARRNHWHELIKVSLAPTFLLIMASWRITLPGANTLCPSNSAITQTEQRFGEAADSMIQAILAANPAPSSTGSVYSTSSIAVAHPAPSIAGTETTLVMSDTISVTTSEGNVTNNEGSVASSEDSSVVSDDSDDLSPEDEARIVALLFSRIRRANREEEAAHTVYGDPLVRDPESRASDDEHDGGLAAATTPMQDTAGLGFDDEAEADHFFSPDVAAEEANHFFSPDVAAEESVDSESVYSNVTGASESPSFDPIHLPILTPLPTTEQQQFYTDEDDERESLSRQYILAARLARLLYLQQSTIQVANKANRPYHDCQFVELLYWICLNQDGRCPVHRAMWSNPLPLPNSWIKQPSSVPVRERSPISPSHSPTPGQSHQTGHTTLAARLRAGPSSLTRR